jgi:hypothetical protein
LSVLKVYLLDEEPRFTDNDEETELKWVVARFLRNENNVPTGQAPMIEPNKDDFWAGSLTPVDTRPKPITKKEMDEVWKSKGSNIELKQRAYIRLLELRKGPEDYRWGRRRDDENVVTNKRKADGTLNPVAKKARFNRKAFRQKTINENIRRETERDAAVNKRLQNENKTVKRLQEDASLVRELKETQKIDRTEMLTGIQREYDDDEQRKDNEKGAAQKRPALPPRGKWEQQMLNKTTAISALIPVSSDGAIAARVRQGRGLK